MTTLARPASCANQANMQRGSAEIFLGIGLIFLAIVALNLTARQTATVPVAIAKYAQENETKYTAMAAGAVLSVLPSLVLLFFAQRAIVRGLTAGAVK